MEKILSCLILSAALAGLAGCRADDGSRASSEIDSANGSAGRMKEQPSPAEARPVAVEASPVPGDTRPLIVCFGDSLTAGYGADESYPDFLQRDLDRDGYRYRVVNEGVSGNTTKDGVDRLAGVVAMHPAVVVLEFGGNDGLRGFKVETTRSNLSTMIRALEGAGAKVVIAGMTLPPDYGPDYVNSFTAVFPALAKKYDAPVIPFLLSDIYGRPGMIQADGIHATNQGNEGVAKTVLPLVERLLRR